MVTFAQVLFFSATPLFAATVTVTSTADGGGTCPGSDCTLREAILVATSGDDTINFSLPANSVISLTNGELFIESSLTIDGPGANFLTVQRSTAAGMPFFRIFDLDFESVTISGLTIANGSEPNNEGGAIRNKGFLTLNSVTISGNSASIGGGIYNFNSDSQLTIHNSTISGNTASTGGGIENQGTLTLTGCTIAGNTASNGEGAGIKNNATAAITNCTISGNTVTNMGLSGGGLLGNPAGATTTLKNSIVAKNSAPFTPDLAYVTSQGYNFIGDNSGPGFTATTGDQVGTGAAPKDPKLGPLQDNGGPTKTQALTSVAATAATSVPLRCRPTNCQAVRTSAQW
jgi:CSLREA domain-containing protein